MTPVRSAARWVGLLLVLGGAALAPAQGQTPTVYVAFGDSITFGVGDTSTGGDPPGYPGRLQSLLIARGRPSQVVNRGVPGETTAEALSRVGTVLQQGGNVFLLMEGTNDINARLSTETIRFNLDELASRAQARGLEPVHVTVIPRRPTANFDGNNRVTARLAASVRDLAWQERRRLVDPFEVFSTTTDLYSRYYVGGSDQLHPNAAGYDALAAHFADVLTNTDTLPPVLGVVDPLDGSEEVPGSDPVELDLYDFGAGIDLASVSLLINGTAVTTQSAGDSRKLTVTYQPATTLRGRVTVTLRARDTANPVHSLDRVVTDFLVAGTTFLAGDINRDGRVDGTDLVAFGIRFGSNDGDNRYRTFADFNGDGTVDGVDLARLAANFGQASF